MERKVYKSEMSKVRLVREPSGFKKEKITGSESAHDIIKKFYHDDIDLYESFFILLLNRANNTIGYAKISQGGIAGTVVDIKLIAKYAVESLASAVILAHNHPSGNLEPSSEDLKMTTKVKEGLKLLDIKVLDHLIITEDGYKSFADDGLMY